MATDESQLVEKVVNWVYSGPPVNNALFVRRLVSTTRATALGAGRNADDVLGANACLALAVATNESSAQRAEQLLEYVTGTPLWSITPVPVAALEAGVQKLATALDLATYEAPLETSKKPTTTIPGAPFPPIGRPVFPLMPGLGETLFTEQIAKSLSGNGSLSSFKKRLERFNGRRLEDGLNAVRSSNNAESAEKPINRPRFSRLNPRLNENREFRRPLVDPERKLNENSRRPPENEANNRRPLPPTSEMLENPFEAYFPAQPAVPYGTGTEINFATATTFYKRYQEFLKQTKLMDTLDLDSIEAIVDEARNSPSAPELG